MINKRLAFIALAFMTTNAMADTTPPTAPTTTPAPDYSVTNILLGSSVPLTDAPNDIVPDNTTLTEAEGPTRISGGEAFNISFQNKAKKAISRPLQKVKLIAYSKSGAGKILIRAARTEHTPLKLDRAANYNGLIMLSAGDSTEALVTAAQSKNLQLILEAFGNNDASVAVQLSSVGGDPNYRILVERRIVNPKPAPSPDSGSGDDDPRPPTCVSIDPATGNCASYDGPDCHCVAYDPGTFNCATYVGSCF